MTLEKKPITAIVKPTHDCNFSCEYCYLEDEAEDGYMNDETLLKLIKELGKFNSGDISHIIWHGGEPLLVRTDFFEKATYYQYWVEKEEDCKFENSIQTNGSLVDSEWVEFCQRHNFDIGFSLDGPKEMHDQTRKYKVGSSSFDDVLRGINLAREGGIGGGLILVLNKKNIGSLDEIFEFLKENNLGAKINPLIKSGNAKRNYEDLGITPIEYGNAMKHLFDRYFGDDDFKVNLDPFDIIIGNVATGSAYGCCTFSKSCQESFISIGPQGDVYPCGRFDGIKEFKLGNIHEDSLEDISNNPLRSYLQTKRIEQIESCKSCEYTPICNAGCLSNGFMRKGDVVDKDYYCAGYQILFKHIKGRLKEEFQMANVGDKK